MSSQTTTAAPTTVEITHWLVQKGLYGGAYAAACRDQTVDVVDDLFDVFEESTDDEPRPEDPDGFRRLHLRVREWFAGADDAALVEFGEHLRAAGSVRCSVCRYPVPLATAHVVADGHVGDDCCWDERLRGGGE
jgi:hypothetical protein